MQLPQPGQWIGPYQILRELGRGGMGAVFLAHKDGSQYAIKVLLGFDEDSWLRFEREALAMAKIQHPGIVPIHSYGLNPVPHIVLPYIQGQTLEGLIKEGPLPEQQALEIIHSLAQSLSAIHSAGLLHRDLKPANIFIRQHDGQVLIGDFGLARDNAQHSLTKTGEIVGTPHFMAPEQLEGERLELGPHTDIWSLGVILYQLSTNHFPFGHKASSLTELAFQILETQPPPPGSLESLSRDFDSITLKCLQKDPRQRYQSARALATDCSRALRGERPSSHSRLPGPLLQISNKLHSRAFKALAFALLIALALTSYVFISYRQQQQRRAALIQAINHCRPHRDRILLGTLLQSCAQQHPDLKAPRSAITKQLQAFTTQPNAIDKVEQRRHGLLALCTNKVPSNSPYESFLNGCDALAKNQPERARAFFENSPKNLANPTALALALTRLLQGQPSNPHLPLQQLAESPNKDLVPLFQKAHLNLYTQLLSNALLIDQQPLTSFKPLLLTFLENTHAQTRGHALLTTIDRQTQNTPAHLDAIENTLLPLIPTALHDSAPAQRLYARLALRALRQGDLIKTLKLYRRYLQGPSKSRLQTIDQHLLERLRTSLSFLGNRPDERQRFYEMLFHLSTVGYLTPLPQRQAFKLKGFGVLDKLTTTTPNDPYLQLWWGLYYCSPSKHRNSKADLYRALRHLTRFLDSPCPYLHLRAVALEGRAAILHDLTRKDPNANPSQLQKRRFQDLLAASKLPHPSPWQLLKGLARAVYNQQGDLARARQYFAKARESIQKALQALQKNDRRLPHYPLCRYEEVGANTYPGLRSLLLFHEAQLLSKKHPQVALPIIQQSVQLYPQRLDAYGLLAKLQKTLGHPQQALETVRTATLRVLGSEDSLAKFDVFDSDPDLLPHVINIALQKRCWDFAKLKIERYSSYSNEEANQLMSKLNKLKAHGQK